MCLGIPMLIVDVHGLSARCEASGIARTVSLLLLQDDPPSPGDHVIVHSGYALQVIDADRAREIRSLWEEAERDWPPHGHR
jgi:hydrogenase expression/formation protein HypC